jgi:molybdate transport system permease protein
MDLSPAEWTAIWLSLKIATTATIASLPFGILVAYALARWRFPGKMLLNGAVHLPLVMPPVVTGFLLLMLLGRFDRFWQQQKLRTFESGNVSHVRF